MSLQKEKDLVFAVDDEQDNLDLLRRILGNLCRLRLFTSSTAALEAAKHEAPSLLLVDHSMPELNGTELLKALRAASVHCGAIFVTAYPDAADVKQLVAAEEAFWVVPKPYNPGDLASQVTMALSLSKMRSRRTKMSP